MYDVNGLRCCKACAVKYSDDEELKSSTDDDPMDNHSLSDLKEVLA